MILYTWQDFRAQFATTATVGPDGVELWPVAKVHIISNVTRASIPRPITEFPLTITQSSSVDGVGGIHDWYLSQRTDDAALQYFSLTQPDPLRSGIVVMALTSKAVSDLGLSGPTDTLNEDHLRQLLANVGIYVQRRTDDAIGWVDILPFTLAEIQFE